MIEAGACAIQIENQVSDEKQCGHQDGKVTVPHEDFIQKIRAIRYAFLELGVPEGIIVTRTDSLGAGLTKQIAYSREPGDLGDQYNAFLDCEEITAGQAKDGDVLIRREGKLLRPKRLPSNLYQFRPGTGADRCEAWACTQDPQAALRLAEEHAWLMASEIRASGVDLSFAPVVDLGRGNLAIGNRAFSDDPQVVAAFTRAYVRGMHSVGMAATLKHFPGHGTVLEDTHVDDAVDPRPLEALRAQDLVPFAAGIEAGADAVMMAHVAYPAVAPEPAGYSRRWIEEILRGDRADGGLGFRGVVFSDDIGMAAAYSAGGIRARIDAHLDAGCDVVLVCHPELVDESLRAVEGRQLNTAALTGLIGRGALGWDGLLADARHAGAQSRLSPVSIA